MKELNFGGDAPRVNTSRLGELSELVEEMEARRERVERIEEQLKSAKADLAEIEEGSGPELMDELRAEKHVTRGGLSVEVKKELVHSLGRDDAARKARALSILRQLGVGGVISNMVIAEFPVGQDERADELLSELRERGYSAKREEGVHPSRLKSTLKELLTRGVLIPEMSETFGAYWRRWLKVTRKG